MPMDKDEQPENSSTDKNVEQQPSSSKKTKKQDKSQPRGEYKVVFKGNVLEGFTKEQVVANIAKLTKLPSEKIQKKFFSGKAVIIRRAHDETHAQKLQQLFTNAGLEVVILKDATRKTSQQSGIPEHLLSNDRET